MKISGYYLSLIVAIFATNAYGETPIQIVQNATYHGDEVQDVKDGDRWNAIVKTNDGYRVEEVKISVKTVKDEILDIDSGFFTGKEISSVPPAVFLIKGMALEDNAPIKSYPFNPSTLESEKPVEIKGDRARLSLVFSKAGQIIAKLAEKEISLTEPMSSDEKSPELIWAGDLNNDGYPDLLIDTTDHYNISLPTLFLSKITGEDISYNKVAERRSAGC